jgi:hypothetical protein
MKLETGAMYTLEQLLTELDLPDSPSLYFAKRSGVAYVQHSIFDYKEFLAIPQWSKTVWKYKYTTREWVPVFEAVQPDVIAYLCEMKFIYDGWYGYPKLEACPCGYCGSMAGYSAEYPGQWESCNSCNGV